MVVLGSCRFVGAMERLTAFHKPFIRMMKAQLVGSLSRSTGQVLAMVLDTLRRGADLIPDLLEDLWPQLQRGNLLTHINEGIQLNTLELLAVLLQRKQPRSGAAASIA